MIDSRQAERMREAFAASIEIAGRGASCPPADQLWASAHGELDRGADEQVLLHCGECGACAESWRSARACTGLATTRYRWAAAAVVVLGLAGLAAFLIPRFSSDPQPVFRQQGETRIESTTATAPLSRDRFELSWTSLSDGARHDLRVMTEDLESLHAAWNLDEARFTVPAEALAPLEPGSRVLWQVTARLPDGSAVVSDTFATTVE